MVGTAPDLARRLGELSDAGLSQVMLLPPLAAKEDVLRDVATEVCFMKHILIDKVLL